MEKKNKKNIKFKKREKVLTSIIALLIIVAVTVFIALINENNNIVYKDEFVDERFEFLLNNNAIELPKSNVIDKTNDAIDKILDNYNSKKYTISKPYVLLNPFGNAPLSALILFNTDKNESIEVTIKGKNDDDMIYNFSESKDHFIPIYNLYNNYENEIIIKSSSGKSKSIKIFTNYSIDIELEQLVDNKENNDLYYSLFENMIVGFDSHGEVRSVLNNINTTNFIFDNDDIIYTDISNNEILSIDLLGRINKIYEVDKLYFNYIKYNDNLLIVDNNCFIELDTKIGKFIKSININELLNITDKIIITDFDIKDDNLVFYLDNTKSIVSINYKTNSINYIIGNKFNWNVSYRKYVLEKGDNYVGSYQTNALSIDNNIIYTLNNKAENNVLIYQIDENSKKVSVINKIDNNNYSSYGNNSIFQDDYLNIYINDKNQSSYIYELNNNKVIYNFKFNKLINKIIKHNIKNNKYYNVNSGNYYYYKNDAPYERLEEDELLEFKNAENKSINLMIINNQLYIEDSSDIELFLISPKGFGFKYLLNNTNKVNLNLLNKGKYYVCYKIGDKLYNSKRYIITQ